MNGRLIFNMFLTIFLKFIACATVFSYICIPFAAARSLSGAT